MTPLDQNIQKIDLATRSFIRFLGLPSATLAISVNLPRCNSEKSDEEASEPLP